MNLLSMLDGVKQDGPNRWRAKCPVHGGNNKTALVVTDANGTTIAHCFNCGANGLDVAEALGIDPQELFPESVRRDPHTHIKPNKTPFNYRDVLMALEEEVIFLFFAADTMSKGKTLKDSDKERLNVSRARWEAALTVAGLDDAKLREIRKATMGAL